MKLYLIGEDLWQYVERATGFGEEKHNAKVMYIISKCLGDDDQEDILDKNTAKDLWDAIYNKYEEKLPSMDKQYLQDFIGYKKPTDSSRTPRPPVLRCHLCDMSHEIKDCPDRDEFNCFVRWSRMEQNYKSKSKKKHRVYNTEEYTHLAIEKESQK